MSLEAWTRGLLKKANLRLKKSLDQHFLIDEAACSLMIESAELDDRSLVLEVGPGIGSLTRELVKTAGRVKAVELDPALAKVLSETVRSEKLEIIRGDILVLRTELALNDLSFTLVSGLPYSISRRVIEFFISRKPRAKRLIVLVQDEVAEKMVAKAGERERSFFSVFVEFYSRPTYLKKVSREAFLPSPKVDSALIRIDPVSPPKVEAKRFFRLLKAGFSAKRKQLQNSLSGGLKLDRDRVRKILKSVNVSPSARPEDLKLEAWLEIFQVASKEGL